MPSILSGFAAYPSSLREVRDTFGQLSQEIQRRHLPLHVDTWENNDIAGYCLVDPILEKIQTADFLVADITRLNFNVIYEIGYAIAKSKRVILLQNRAIRPQPELMQELGLFDTTGWKLYQNSGDLSQYLGRFAVLSG
jgi:hypothetical protein